MIVDDHDMVAESFRRILGSEPDIDVVAVVGTGADALASAKTHKPEVILMDYGLPDTDGVAATAEIKALLPEVKVLLLTGSDARNILPAALEAGCVGYLEKTGPIDRLASSIRSAVAGGLVLSSADLARAVSTPKPSGSGLTARELEVLDAMARGLSTQQIAEQLTMGSATVRAHAQRILNKLDAHSRLAAVATARQRGLLHGG